MDAVKTPVPDRVRRGGGKDGATPLSGAKRTPLSTPRVRVVFFFWFFFFGQSNKGSGAGVDC